MRRHWLLTAFTLSASTLGCGGAAEPDLPRAALQASALDTAPTFDFQIDREIHPTAPSIRGEHGAPVEVGVYIDRRGVATEFTTDELLVRSASDTELQALLARTGGTLVGKNVVPDAPPRRGREIPPSFKQPTWHVIHVDPSQFPLDNFREEGQRRGMLGTYRFSSERAARLMALVSRERLGGLKVMPNYVSHPDDILHRTSEQPLSGGMFDNAFNYTPFLTQQPAAFGNRSTVSAAWQFVAGHGVQNRPEVAIIDSGFWLDGSGNPFDDPTGPRTDLPFSPAQYDFDGEDYLAGGMNLNTCTGGNPCPWHGNASASVATGRVNNQGAMAGTGGQVADPILFNVTLTTFQVEWAVRTAIAWGADVISMSFGGSCNEDCQSARADLDYYQTFNDARSAGIVLVAAAGNNTLDVDANDIQPCTVAGVICVGALGDDSNQAISYSNFGSSVDIWAPTNIPAMANAATWPSLANAGGTSASAPFIAGIAAMMKSMNPALTSDTVRDLLISTRHQPDSLDAKVTAYVDAKAAVVAAANNQISADSLESNDTPATATGLGGMGSLPNQTLHSGSDTDYYRLTLSDYSALSFNVEYMRGLGGIFVSLQPETAPGAPSGVVQKTTDIGMEYQGTLLAPGTYLLRMGSYTAQPYRLTWNVTLKGLQPDIFEVNNTFATAALPTPGESFEVNLHTASDVDYYKFDASNLSVLQGYAFDISSADMPVSVSVYDEVGNLKSTHAAATKHQIQLGKGVWVVRVSGSQKGRYIFSAGAYKYDICRGRCVAIDKFWWLDIGGPVERWLVELDDGYYFEMSERTQKLKLTGLGMHVKVMDLEGNVLAEGVPAVDERGTQLGEVLSLERLRQGQEYAVAVSRVDRGSRESVLPALSYQVELGLARY